MLIFIIHNTLFALQIMIHNSMKSAMILNKKFTYENELNTGKSVVLTELIFFYMFEEWLRN